MTENDSSIPPNPNSERRAHHRLALTVPAEVAAGPVVLPAALLSLSLGGAALRTDLSAAVGQPLEVRLRLPDVGWVVVSAEVVRVRPRALGVRFLALEPSVLAVLAALLGRT